MSGRARTGSVRRAGVRTVGLVLALLSAGSPAAAQVAPGKPGAAPVVAREDPWPISARCERGKIPAREYSRCLYDAIQLSDKVLQAALDTAYGVVDARADLAAVQRSRWKTQLQEAQTRFVMFRNFDCQGVAPYEGTRGIGNFEQRALCLIATNERRARDLRLRYGDIPPAPPPADPALNAGTRPATWVQAVSRPLD